MALMTVPTVGLGTFLLSESCEASVTAALDLGCSLIDTGELYGNLEFVGTAIKNHVRKPCIITKLSGMPVGEYEAVRARVKAMFEKLRVEKTEVCLMHWPGLCSWDPTDHAPLASPADFKPSSWQEFCDNIAPAWANMVKLKEEGLISEIGTSNFYAHHLAELAARCDGAVPFANEIFVDASNQENEFIASMQSKGIRVLAYRPVIYKPFPDAVKHVAERHGDVSQQTVVLAWLLKRGVFPLVKCRGTHIQENMMTPVELKDRLSEADLQDLKKADTGSLRFSAEWFGKIWSSHNQSSAVSEEDVQMLVGMGVDEVKARAALEASGGNIDAAMDVAFS